MKWRRYQADSAGLGYEVQRPTRPPSWESDVAVPLGQALVTGLALGSSATLGGWYFAQIPLWPTWGVAVGVAIGLAWLWRMGAVGETLWAIERTLGVDLDGDGEVGEPEAHIVTLRANGASAPEDPEVRLRGEFVTFVKGCLAAGSTGSRRWEESGMSRLQYNEFRDRLIGAGLARWRNPNRPQQGWEITASEEDIVSRIM